ncbi:MAG TPA: myxosortase-dependent M36 family metallopeptidase [Myxococcus sp.]|nr:myxosortase-dependent M36 family metallopeptidase [Myxococcus sp.]
MRRLVATLSGLALVLSGTSATARTLPNFDALQNAKPAGRANAGFKSAQAIGARVAHRDSLTDTPTFVWAKRDAGQTKLRAEFASMAPADAALTQLKDHAELYGLSSFESAGARVVGVSQNRQGVKVVKVAQEAGGIEVFRQNLNLLLDRNNELVAISGTLSRHVSATVASERVRFQLTAAQAIAAAYQDLTGSALDASLLQRTGGKADAGKYVHYKLADYARQPAESLIIPARAKQVLYSLPNALVPAYYVEVNTGRADSTESDYYGYVINAADGSLLMRNNLEAHAEYSYRVFADTTPPFQPWEGPSGNVVTPHPTGNPDGFRPPYRAPALVTLENAPFSQNDPWLPDGATVTTGNNVDAYADLTAPDNYNAGDLRPSVSAPGVFDYTFRFDIQPNANADQIAAATTSLFFLNNWLHDWFYDSGFDEASGNAQADNFGRGGIGGDAIRAQAQDYTGTNNANMQTPSDGASPRMQMYIFSGARNARLTVNTPASVAGDYQAGIAAGFGPQLFDLTGDVVAALDEANAAGQSTFDACSPLTNAADVAGKIAMLDRGTCPFVNKMVNAQNAGAIGVIINDNAPGFVTDIGGSAANITIPAMRLTQAHGNLLRAALPQGVNVRMFRGPTIALDGTLDNQIVAHEWGHYISNRLIGNAAGLVNNQGRAMGEGWGDFTALLMTVRAEDINVPSNANWTGVYAMAEYATRGISPDASFFGIRRGAYSVNPAKNALRFRHIMDGVPLPTTTPFAPGGVNSQVHNSGEVWASTLWEGYVSLLRAHPFQEAQERMKNYVVNGYKMTPVAPTYTEARDAVLAAALANDRADFDRLWAAFARRGMGVGAVAPERFSTNHAGVVESYTLGVEVEIEEVEFRDDVATGSCDRDGILDNGETGRLVFTVHNTGSATSSKTSITVVSSSQGVQVGNRGFVEVPAVLAGDRTEVSVPVTLRGAPRSAITTFTYAIRDDDQVVPGDKSGALSFKVNYDEVPGTSAIETVEARASNLPWTTESAPALATGEFEVVTFIEDLNRAFFGPNLGAASDIRLVTPALQVGDAPFSFTFNHAYDFESDEDVNYDGAVIEISSDGGQTWVDIGTDVYTGGIVNDPAGRNPLAGRRGFVGTTENFPSFTTTTVNLGTAYAGQTVQIRFRIGSDAAVAYTGWVIDDIAFSGITNTPFTGIVADRAVCANRAPMVDAGANQTVAERSQVSVTGTASDRDPNTTLTYLWERVSGPQVVLNNANTLTVSFTAPEVTREESLVLRLTASDGSLSGSDTVIVRIQNVNRAPTVNAGADGVANERANATLTGSASDADGDSLTYLWTQVSGTPVALRDYNAATASFSAPEVRVAETLTFRLTVSDGQTSVNDTVDVVVNNVNRAPVVTASSVSVNERSTATLTASATDADGDTVTYAWTQLSGETVELTGADTANASFATGEVAADAVLAFRVTASDGTETATQDVVVNVRHVNRAPTVNAGLDGAVNERGNGSLNGSATDADGDELTYSWVQTAGTPVALSNASSAQATFTAPETVNGDTLTFLLTVSDGRSSVSDTVNVTVNAVNRAPAVSAAAVTVEERGTANLMAAGTDPDNDSLTYSWTQVNGPQVTLTGANTAAPSFATGEVTADTELTFQVTVSDGTLTASQNVVVTVRHVNRAPVANAGMAAAVAARASATLDGRGSSDPEGTTVTYAWTQVGGPAVTLTGANTAQPSFTAPDVKASTELTFRLVVSDGSLTSSATVVITVTASNRAPVAKGNIILNGSQTSMTLDGSGSSDPDADALTYKWEQTGGPAVQLGNPNQAVLSVDVPKFKGKSATFSFKLTVTDARGGTHSATVEATATPDDGGGCNSTGAGAPAGMLGLVLLALVNRRRRLN